MPTRKPQKRAAEIHGFFLRQASTFDENRYHPRSLMETMHSTSKRVMGEAVRART
ncbi:MAG: hypothetical protein ABR986_11430 [Methanomassiliicoccales archaeon]